MKSHKLVSILSAAVIVATSVTAQAADPVAGGSIMAVNVDIVATTGFRASKLLGSDIYNDNGEKIGKLDDFIVGSDENISVAVLAIGGMLGMGARMVAVPAELFETNAEGQTVLPGATEEQLKALPEFLYAK